MMQVKPKKSMAQNLRQNLFQSFARSVHAWVKHRALFENLFQNFQWWDLFQSHQVLAALLPCAKLSGVVPFPKQPGSCSLSLFQSCQVLLT